MASGMWAKIKSNEKRKEKRDKCHKLGKCTYCFKDKDDIQFRMCIDCRRKSNESSKRNRESQSRH